MNIKGEAVGRKEFLLNCQKCAVLHGKDIPGSLTVEYNNIPYFPYGYKLLFDEKGNPKHIAILHDLKANSVLECELKEAV